MAKVIGYTYEADHHCAECAIMRFSAELLDEYSHVEFYDSEGNPVHALFEHEVHGLEYCGDCGTAL
jgi:hypothetical protein